MLVDANVAKLQSWLEAVERTDGPRAAFDCYLKLLEYHVPKLARHELAGPPGEPVQMIVRWKGGAVNITPSGKFNLGKSNGAR